MKNSLLFVNKSKDSYSKGTTESRAIASHAQKHYQRRLRNQQIVANQSRTTARAVIRASNTKRADDTSTASDASDEELSAVELSLARLMNSPTNSINEYALSTLPLDKGSFEILQYFLNVETWDSREVWQEDYLYTYEDYHHETDNPALQLSSEKSYLIRPSGKLDGHKKKYFSALGQIIQGCLNSPVHMYALLTMTSCGMRNAAGVPVATYRHAPEFFMAKVLPHLRGEVAKISAGAYLIDKQVLLDIFYLFAYEWWQQRYDAALTHLRIVLSLEAQLDGTVPLDRYIYEGAVYDDVMICLETGTRPIRTALDWAPPDLSAGEKREIRAGLEELRLAGLYEHPGVSSSDLRFKKRRTLAIFLVPLKTDERTAPIIVLSSDMGVGLIRACEKMQNEHMTRLMKDVLFLIEVMQYTWIANASVARYAQWSTKKVHAVLHVLLSMHLVGEWECVRLAMVMMLSVVSSNRAWKSGELNARRLQAALMGSLNHLKLENTVLSNFDLAKRIIVDFADQRMLLWVLVVGAANALHGFVREWFVKEAAKTARNLDLRTGAELREVLVEYLCLLRSQQTVVQELAVILEAG